MSLLRHAKPDDIPALRDLIAQSGRDLSAPYYTSEQIQAVTRHVFGVDSQLIEDQTYSVIEAEEAIVACGGWSKRRTLFGGDQAKAGPDPLLGGRKGTKGDASISRRVPLTRSVQINRCVPFISD